MTAMLLECLDLTVLKCCTVGKQLVEVKRHSAPVLQIKYTAAGDRLITTSGDRTMKVLC